MDSLLDALQEGRLIELPDNDKFHALQFLSHIIEAVPSVPNAADVSGLVLAREYSAVTALGRGFACPHARVPYDDDLICSVGWSPQGIDYGAPDNKPVHIVIMYLVPDNQRNHYLKEIALMAKALITINSDTDSLSQIGDLDTVRNYLLDLVSSSKSLTGSEARARMVQLESRSAMHSAEMYNLSDLITEPVTLIGDHNLKQIVLSQNKELSELMDGSPDIVDCISNKGVFEKSGWRIIKRSATNYQLNRVLYDCVAVKINNNPK